VEKYKRPVILGTVILVCASVYYLAVARFREITPLMAAARAGDAELVVRELESGADPNRAWNEGFRIHGTPRSGVTPLLFALESYAPVSASRAQVVRELLKAGADPCVAERGVGSALVMAVNTGDVDVVRPIWEHDRAGCLTASSAAAVQSAYSELSLSPEDPKAWALVEYVVDHVAQPGDADHPSLLITATGSGSKASLDRLFARGVKADGRSLVTASIQGRAELIPWLVEHGADVNAVVTDDPGEAAPPLVLAAAHPNENGFRALLDAGADANARDDSGQTALSRLACDFSCTTRPNPICESQLASIRLLLERGARVEGTDRIGQKDVARCVRERRLDPYRSDLEDLLGLARDPEG
jgi:ankyrin repeat protein